MPSVGVDQRHAGGKEQREDQDGEDRQAFTGLDGSDAEQPDLGGGVESQTEEHADRIHLPTAVDHAAAAGGRIVPAGRAGRASRRARRSAGVSPRRARLNAAKMSSEHDQIDGGDQQEKERRDRRTDERAEALQRRQVIFDYCRRRPRSRARARRPLSSVRTKRRNRRRSGAAAPASACA